MNGVVHPTGWEDLIQIATPSILPKLAKKEIVMSILKPGTKSNCPTENIRRLALCALAHLRSRGILTQCSICGAQMEGTEGTVSTPGGLIIITMCDDCANAPEKRLRIINDQWAAELTPLATFIHIPAAPSERADVIRWLEVLAGKSLAQVMDN
jgi:transcription elongation factor Elf1